jgi:hypothetical protein
VGSVTAVSADDRDPGTLAADPDHVPADPADAEENDPDRAQTGLLAVASPGRERVSAAQIAVVTFPGSFPDRAQTVRRGTRGGETRDAFT